MKRAHTLLLLLVAFYGHAQIVKDGLVAAYTFNNSIDDYSGNNNNGLNATAVTAAADRYGNTCGAMAFNGSSSWFTVPSSASNCQLSTSFTITCWFKADKTANGDLVLPLFAKGNAANAQYQLGIYRQFGDSYSKIAASNDFTGEDKSYNDHQLDFDNWYFIALTYDEGWIKLYINGKPIWQQMKAKPFVKNDLALEVGCCSLNGSMRYFKGSLDDLYFYNRALAPYEINNLMKDNSDQNLQQVFTIQTPPDLELGTDGGKCSAALSFGEPKVNISCGSYELKQVQGLPSGSVFDLGTHPIIYEATAGGKTISAAFNITIKDKQPPILRCPMDIVLKAPADKNGANVEYLEVTATDNCSSAKVEKVSGPSSGSFFPIGTTPVTYSATDEAGNKMECTFKVTVIEDITPVPHCMQDIAVFVAPGERARQINYEEPYVTVKDQKISMTRTAGPASGSHFPVGETSVRYELNSDVNGHIECNFKVTVRDTTFPVINCIEDIKVKAEAGEKSALVTYTTPHATDGGKDLAVKLEEGLAGGSKFPIGNTVVKYTATDADGNQSSCSFMVTVIKTDVTGAIKPLSLTCPSDVEKGNERGKNGAVVKYGAPQYSGQEVKLMQSSGLQSGAYFPIGKTVNSYRVTDVMGNTKECSFTVEVHDNEPPQLKCPGDSVIMLSPGRRGVQFYYQMPEPTDNNRIDTFEQVQGSKSGCFLPLGVHTYAFKTKDATGNMETCSFNVTVKSQESPDIQVQAPAQLSSRLNLGTDTIKYEYHVDVKDCALTVLMYDDGEEDNDIVSIIFNGTVLADHEVLKLKDNGAMKRVIQLGVGAENYLVAKAWNTGRVGLNTLRIDVFEGEITDKRALKNAQPVYSKVLHSRPGTAGGMILKCNGQ